MLLVSSSNGLYEKIAARIHNQGDIIRQRRMLLEDEEDMYYETLDYKEVSEADFVPQCIPSSLVFPYVP